MALTDGLWAFWRLGEAAGSARADSSGNGRALAESGGAVGSVPAAIGRGAVFSGGGERLALADALPAGPFSVSLWVQLLAVTVSPPSFWRQDGDAGPLQNLFALGSNYRFATQDALGVFTGHGAVPLPGFHHVAGVHDDAAQTITLYLDGSAHGTLPGEGMTAGATQTLLGAGLKGALSLAGVWARALSGDEVAALWNGGQGLDPTE